MLLFCWIILFPAIYFKQINNSRAKFILIDDKTRPIIQEAISMLDYQVTQFCFGDVEGATSVDELFNDDGSGKNKSHE
jgi:Na+-transporting NADH:ubiquinone oxidoreductase subunit NqrB